MILEISFTLHAIRDLIIHISKTYKERQVNVTPIHINIKVNKFNLFLLLFLFCFWTWTINNYYFKCLNKMLVELLTADYIIW